MSKLLPGRANNDIKNYWNGPLTQKVGRGRASCRGRVGRVVARRSAGKAACNAAPPALVWPCGAPAPPPPARCAPQAVNQAPPSSLPFSHATHNTRRTNTLQVADGILLDRHKDKTLKELLQMGPDGGGPEASGSQGAAPLLGPFGAVSFCGGCL